MNFGSSIEEIKGIGNKNAALFQKLNIDSAGDLLFHFPRDYVCMEPAADLASLESVGGSGGVFATVISAPVSRYYNRKSSVSFDARDDKGNVVSITYFHMPYLSKTVKSGASYVFYGQLFCKNARYHMTQPKMYKPDQYRAMTGQLQSVYTKTKGISDASIGKYAKAALDQIRKDAENIGANYEYLPDEILKKRDFPSVFDALQRIHFPESASELLPARERFSYEELFLFLLSVKSRSAGRKPNPNVMIETADTTRLIEKLPYSLTDSQKKAYEAIKNDLTSPYCMNRLLQGDVGCGKTIVAILGMLMCVANGHQAVLMAPTEVLARQHYITISEMTKQYGLPFTCSLLSGSTPAAEKRRIYCELKDGSINVAVGTHALIQEPLEFHDLALAVIDEQHRFGVRQRETLQSKAKGGVHTIVMSATPIPRSLAIVLYGGLDITQMPDMPASRLPIKNCVVDQKYRNTAYKFMSDQIREGRQVYIICPMAQPGVMDGLENVVEYASQLREYFPDSVRIEYLHGKMRPAQKNEIMERFASGQTDILVSTTVVEVGVNVPNATVMMVENAERFGLATLHQIRGRVGRGSHQSYCVFMETESRGKKNERLDILNHSNSGFEIAEKDLKLRGPGDLMGIEQSGDFSFRFADIYRDHQLVLQAASDADELIGKDPGLSLPEHKLLKKRLDDYLESGYLEVL
ncbi:MAG: ATP-dependent DNA helicase RecG [Lachnospiraceae bacterium]|nr:ATP-dependent DNA helicase RecG [Lachnospiraceae bacterium]